MKTHECFYCGKNDAVWDIAIRKYYCRSCDKYFSFKKKLNNQVMKVIEARKEQKKILEEGIIKPIQDIIKLGQLVITGQKSVKQFVHQNEKLGEHLNALLKTNK